MTKKLEKLSKKYKISEDFDLVLMKQSFKLARNYFCGNNFLELGCATGESTLELITSAKNLETVDVVEGSKRYIKQAKKLIKKSDPEIPVTFYHSLWEDYSYPKSKYSDVLWFGGIEHVKKPKNILKKISRTLIPNGRLHIITPNALSLHRRIGVYAGYLKKPHELNKRDKQIMGHIKIYDRIQLQKIFKEAQFKEIAWHGVMLKPLPNKEMLKLWKKRKNTVLAFAKAGEEIPDYCAELYFSLTPS